LMQRAGKAAARLALAIAPHAKKYGLLAVLATTVAMV